MAPFSRANRTTLVRFEFSILNFLQNLLKLNLNQWNGPCLRTKINKILKFYAHFRYLFLLGFCVPAYVFVVLYFLLFVAQVRLNYPLLQYFCYKINDRFYCQKGRVIATQFRGLF
jgi:hypothetical protein